MTAAALATATDVIRGLGLLAGAGVLYVAAHSHRAGLARLRNHRKDHRPCPR